MDDNNIAECCLFDKYLIEMNILLYVPYRIIKKHGYYGGYNNIFLEQYLQLFKVVTVPDNN